MRILDRLQAAGLIERRPHEKDRRVWLLHLTAEARPVLERMRQIGAITRAEALEGIPESGSRAAPRHSHRDEDKPHPGLQRAADDERRSDHG